MTDSRTTDHDGITKITKVTKNTKKNCLPEFLVIFSWSS
jgi:hypothetical protein